MNAFHDLVTDEALSFAGVKLQSSCIDFFFLNRFVSFEQEMMPSLKEFFRLLKVTIKVELL